VRFFQIFKVDLGSRIEIKEIVYIVTLCLLSFAIYVWGVKLQTIYALNGAILGYIYVILIPIWIHFKCVWVNRSSGTIERDDAWNNKIRPNICECQVHYCSKWMLYF
jgi:hypothetical protein